MTLFRGLFCAALAVLVLLLSPVLAEEAPVKTFNVADYGAQPGQDNSAPFIRAAIEAAKAAGPGAEVVIGPGEYRVMPEPNGGFCFPLIDAKGLTVRGIPGATHLVIFNPRSGGFLIQNSDDTWVRDVTIDYDPLPFTQGLVTAVDEAGKSFDFEVQEGYPLLTDWYFNDLPKPFGKWGMLYERDQRRLKKGAPDFCFIDEFETLAGRTFRMHVAAGQEWKLKHFAVGDRYVQLARSGNPPVNFQISRGCGVEDFTVYTGGGLASAVIGSRDTTLRRFRVMFKPDTDRLLTTCADGVHCQANIKGPLVEECLFEGMADDTINIYVPPNIVRQIVSPTEVLVTPGALVLPGETLQVYDPVTGLVRGNVKAVDVALADLEGQRLLRVTLEHPVEGLKAGKDHTDADTLFTLDRSGSGFIIRNNIMREHRRYAVLLSAGDGIIEGNLIDNTSGNAIEIANSPDWPEGPVGQHYIVRGNTFIGGGYCQGYADNPSVGVVNVRTPKYGFSAADVPFERDVLIEDNTFIDMPATAIHVASCIGVRLRNNVIKSKADAWLARACPLLLFENSEQVTIEGLELDDPRPGITSGLEWRPASSGQSPTITGLEVQLSEGIPALLEK